jgi:hypothetical protein
MYSQRHRFVGLIAALTATLPLNAGPLDTWHARTPPSPLTGLQGINYCGGVFVAVGGNGSSTNILTSPDGVDWTPRHANAINYLNAVAWGNETYVAVGTQTDPPSGSSYAAVVTSSDGVVWTGQRLATNAALNAVTFANGLFVAVGIDWQSNNALVMTSTNGTSWFSRSLTNLPSGILEGVDYGNGLFAAGSLSGGPLLVLPDGINWTNRGNLSAGWHRAIIYADGRFVVAGGPTTFCCIPLISTSPNLDDWTTQITEGGTHYNSAVAFGAGTWAAVGDSDHIAYSTDTLVWTQRELPGADPYLRAVVAYGKGTFVVVDGGGGIWQSDPLPTARLMVGALSRQGLPLKITGEEGLSYRLQAADKLPSTNWNDLLTFTDAAPATNFVDMDATNFNQRFYRVVSP